MIGLQTTSTRPRLTKAVSKSFATANSDGSLLDEARSMLSSESLHKASIKYLTDESESSVEDSKRRVTMLERTGRSAITAVVMTELFSMPDDPVVVKAPPVIGFRPRIHTRCCKV